MSNDEHLKILKRGAEVWNKWRKQNATIRPDLSGAELGRADLFIVGLTHAGFDRGDLSSVDFDRVNLCEANLATANLVLTNFSEANFTGADLTMADFRSADLTGANFSGADLSMADFRNAHLVGADMRGSTAWRTLFVDVNLSQVKGLETVKHKGPSTIGFDTIYRSENKIPEVFLRGCGVGDDLIATIRAMQGAVTFNSCFISFSTRDQEFADRLHADLQGKGVRCWFAPHDMKAGRKLHEQIDQAIRVHERLLLILSLHSMNSEWVKDEIARARKREAEEKKQVLFPIGLVDFEEIKKWECFDADRGRDSAREIREYYVPDFSNWKDEVAYQEALQRLLQGLKGEQKKKGTA
jgi:uncharacterized protein YjbI with pentapeptide repeats